MSIYWNNVLMKKLQKTTKIINKFRLTTDIGRFYFYFQKDDKLENAKISVKILFFPN